MKAAPIFHNQTNLIMAEEKKPFKIGYNDGSGPEYITSNNKPIVTIRWGCSCCKNTPAGFDDLSDKEQEHMRRIVAAVNYCAGIPTETLETGYQKTELECKGCDGQCGRCQEIKISELQAENTRLRAAISEMERMLPALEYVQTLGAVWKVVKNKTGLENIDDYRNALENAKK